MTCPVTAWSARVPLNVGYAGVASVDAPRDARCYSPGEERGDCRHDKWYQKLSGNSREVRGARPTLRVAFTRHKDREHKDNHHAD